MSVEVVARKDFQDAVRSRWLLGLSAAFTLLVAGGVWLVRDASGFGTTAVVSSIVIRDVLVTTLVPLIALVIAYNAVVGERESGSLKLLLSLPHSRSDVVFGKVIGRTGTMAVPIGVGFLLPVLIAAVGQLRFRPGLYLGFVALVVLLAAAFVSIAVGFSAAVASNRLAVGGAIGIYFLFVPLWGAVQFPLRLYLGFSGTPGWLPLTGQELLRTLRLLNPVGSFKIVSGEFVGGRLFAAAGEGFGTNIEIAAIVMLIVWILGPPLAGLLRFEDADL